MRLRQEKINSEELAGRIIPSIKDLTWEDLNAGSVIGEFAGYLATDAHCYLKIDRAPISYQTAIGYMNSVRGLMIEIYHKRGVSHQPEILIYSRMLTKIRSEKWQYASINKEKLCWSKDATSEQDKMGLTAICLWGGCLKNAEF